MPKSPSSPSPPTTVPSPTPAIEQLPVQEQGSSPQGATVSQETGWVITPEGAMGNATDIKWVEPKGAAKYPRVHRTAPQQGLMQRQMSTVPRLRSPGMQVKFEEGEL